VPEAWRPPRRPHRSRRSPGTGAHRALPATAAARGRHGHGGVAADPRTGGASRRGGQQTDEERFRDAPISNGNAADARPRSELTSSRWGAGPVVLGPLGDSSTGFERIMAGTPRPGVTHVGGTRRPKFLAHRHHFLVRALESMCGCGPPVQQTWELPQPRTSMGIWDRPGHRLTSLTSRDPASGPPRSATRPACVHVTGHPPRPGHGDRPGTAQVLPTRVMRGKRAGGGLPAKYHDVRPWAGFQAVADHGLRPENTRPSEKEWGW